MKEENKNNFDWNKYYELVAQNPARDTVIKANELFQNSKIANLYALDLGCGAGRDTMFLLENNWNVLAIDGEEGGIKYFLNEYGEKFGSKLKTEIIKFEELDLKKNFDLINSSYALPYCKPDSFASLWAKLHKALKKGGRFSGQLFGVNDEWTEYTDMNFHTREEVEEIFSDYDLEYFDEVEKEGPTSQGILKHWHVFHIVGKKQ